MEGHRKVAILVAVTVGLVISAFLAVSIADGWPGASPPEASASQNGRVTGLQSV